MTTKILIKNGDTIAWRDGQNTVTENLGAGVFQDPTFIRHIIRNGTMLYPVRHPRTGWTLVTVPED